MGTTFSEPGKAMRSNLTFLGFLRQYVKERSGKNTLSTKSSLPAAAAFPSCANHCFCTLYSAGSSKHCAVLFRLNQMNPCRNFVMTLGTSSRSKCCSKKMRFFQNVCAACGPVAFQFVTERLPKIISKSWYAKRLSLSYPTKRFPYTRFAKTWSWIVNKIQEIRLSQK